MIELKPCPCGETPISITVSHSNSNPKWAYVIGNCCGDWELEFRNNYNTIGSTESDALAIKRWNAAKRK